MISISQIRFDLRVQQRFLIWMFLRLFMDEQCADLAQKIANQNAALAVHESVDRKRLFAFEIYHTDGIL